MTRIIISLLAASVLFPAAAAVRMRLSETVVGPIVVAAGATLNPRDVEVFAVGDNMLNSETRSLRVALSATQPWVRPTTGNLRPCFGREGQCIPVQLAFSTQSLQAGRYTATVTVSDPSALDAPQNVLVILQVGTPIPDRVALYSAPGSSDAFSFFTNTVVSGAATTQSGGNWLSLAEPSNTTFNFPRSVPVANPQLSIAQPSVSTFDFVRTYQIGARHQAGQAEGNYTGTVTVRNASFQPDNKIVNVSYQVTSNPICDATERAVRFRIAQNSVSLARTLRVFNRGRGTLAFTGATAATTTGGNWLTAAKVEGADFVTLTANPANVNPGVYSGTVTLASNAVNNPFIIPVELEVIAQSPPVIQFMGVLENADFLEGDVIGAGGIVAIKGEQFAYSAPQLSTQTTAPTELNQVRVYVNDQPAPVYFTSYNQVNAQIPYDVRVGEGTVRVDRGGQRGNTVTVRFVSASPKFLRLRLRDAGFRIPEARDFYGIAFHSDGTLSVARDIGFPNGRPSRRGETIVMYGFGFGQTNPPSVAGQPAPTDTLRQVASQQKTMYFGALALNSGIPQEASFVGLIPGFFGVYQINVVVPEDTVSGEVPLRLQLDQVASEYALIAVE